MFAHGKHRKTRKPLHGLYASLVILGLVGSLGFLRPAHAAPKATLVASKALLAINRTPTFERRLHRALMRHVPRPVPTAIISTTTSSPIQVPTVAPPVPSTGGGVGGAFGACVRQRENSGSYAWNTGNGGGAYQFLQSTWYANDPWGYVFGSATPAQQDKVFLLTYARDGTSPWAPYDGC